MKPEQETTARSQSKKLKHEAGAGEIKARAICTVLRDDILIGITSGMTDRRRVRFVGPFVTRRGKPDDQEKQFINGPAAAHTDEFLIMGANHSKAQYN